MKCESCGSLNTVKIGFYYNTLGKYQRYKCQNCGRTFTGEQVLTIEQVMEEKE